jgi:N-formylmaleamate deformylase
VVVPGISQPAVTWEFVALELAESNAVYVLDPRGRGQSGRPATGYGLVDYARDLAATISRLDLVRPVILGHSMGARIAAAFGALHGAQAGPSILVDPPLSGPDREPFPVPLDTYLDALHAAQAGATAEDMRPFFPTWTDEQLAVRAESLKTCDERAIVETYRGFNEEDFHSYWRLLAPPVLLMYGADSNIVSDADIPELRRLNPDARVVCVPDAGHVIPWDNLPGFLAPIREFVQAAGKG